MPPASGPRVHLAGGGPAADAVSSALEDLDVDLSTGPVGDVDDADLGIVVAPAGDDGFYSANTTARANDTPLITIEVGGLGAHALDDVDAGVSLLVPDGPCYECLRTRVTSTDPETAEAARAEPSAVRLAGAQAGRLAVQALRGEDVSGTVLVVPDDRHRLLPAPACDCEPTTPTLDLDDTGTRDLETVVDVAELAVDRRLGPITMLGERESFPAPYYLAALCDTIAFGDGEANEHAAGVASDWDSAFVKAVGEALERYCAARYDTETFHVAPPDGDAAGDATQATVDHVHPDEFVRPDRALPDEIPWTDGVSLPDGATVRLPAEYVAFPPPEEELTPPITTGLGLGNSTAEAVLSGLYETVERDATMLAWYSTFDPLGLQVDDPDFRTLAKRARAEDLEVTPLLVTQDIDVPIVAVAVHRDSDWPKLAFGSSADLDAASAATGALEEALQNWMELRAMGPEESQDAGGAIARYADFPREVRDFVDPETTIPAESVGPNADERPDDPGEELDALVDAVSEVGLTPYVSGLTTRDVRQLGFEAVRVLVPGAQPLFLDDSFFGERARTVPRELGYRPEFNAPPHPFP